MAKAGKLLILDDNKDILSAVSLLVDDYFEKVSTISNPNVLWSTMRQLQPDVVLLDMNFRAGSNNGNEGIYWLQELLDKYPDTKVVLFTAYADIELAVKAIKMGAYDFVEKPWNNEKLISILQRACHEKRNKRKSKTDNIAPTEHNPMFWGNSAEMAKIKKIVEQVAPTDANILITGENGTGKEVMAREIHAISMRHRNKMVSIDMGAIPETLFESELFGHKKGAFTDATADRQGKMEQANGSTLFLDEIGNLPLHLQSKLLVAIQSRTITPLGASKSLNIDIRLISATNRNLFEMVEHGEFRQDLLFRINTIIIHLPPLRSRVEDIIPLAEIFLKHYSEKYGRDIDGITSKATEQMIAYQWNGNIRELQNTMEKAVILCDERMIQPQHLQLQSYTSTISQPITTLEDLERKTIADAIHTCNGNLSVVAQKLGITRQTLYNKIKRYGL